MLQIVPTNKVKLFKFCLKTPSLVQIEKREGFNRFHIRELKQQWQRRLRKRLLKNKFALLQTLSRLFHLDQFVKSCEFFLEFNSKRQYEFSRCLEFTSSTKRKIRHFHVVVAQWRWRNVQKSVVYMQSFCFANLFLFYRVRCLSLLFCIVYLGLCI